jgi:transcriptional regulator with XRE-family HTH domain
MLPVQCKMARVALGWGVRELAAKAEMSPNTIARFERGEALRPETVDDIQFALEQGGVAFLGADARGGPGVRLSKMKLKRKR